MTEGLLMLAGLVLLLGLLWLHNLPRARAEAPAVCALCRWRSGEDCTHPSSPVSGGSCGPVCSGVVACRVREVTR